jgi:hypothetical protein
MRPELAADCGNGSCGQRRRRQLAMVKLRG